MNTRDQLMAAARLVDNSANMLDQLVMDTDEDQELNDQVVASQRAIANALRITAERPAVVSPTEVAMVLARARFERRGFDPDRVKESDVDVLLPEAQAIIAMVASAQEDVRQAALTEVADALADEERRAISRPLGVLGLQGARRIVEGLR